MKTKTTFRLTPINEKEGIIQMLFNYQYKTFDSITGKRKYLPLTYTAGITINKTDWNKEEGKVNKSCIDSKAHNLSLLNMEKEVETVFQQFQYKGVVPSPSELRVELDIRMGRTKEKTPINMATLYDFTKQFIEGAKSSNHKSPKTISNYESFLKDLSTYQIEKGTIVHLTGITEEVYYDMVNWYTYRGFTVKGEFQHYKQNQIWQFIKQLKKFIREAKKEKINVPINIDEKQFAFNLEIPDNIALSFDELKRMYEVDLSKRKGGIEISRDLFIISAFTALRFSDSEQLNELTIEQRNIGDIAMDVLKVKTIKTKETVILPVMDLVRQIYNKYNGSFPIPPSNREFNIHLKTIGKLAGFNELVNVSSVKGDKVVNESFHKYELLSTHTGRRSMCTNFYKLGIPTKTIMTLSGHSTEDSFNRYIKLTKDEHVGLAFQIIQQKMPELI